MSDDINKNEVDIVDSDIIDIDDLDTVKLNNLTVDDILAMSNAEEILYPESVPFENVRNNSKIFLIYYAKNQLGRVLKLTSYLEQLEDKLMKSSEEVTDPRMLINIINTIQNSMNSALSLIDKISTNENYVNLIYNDNRKVINQLGVINSVQDIPLSRESRKKVRNLAESLLTQLSTVEAKEVNIDG